jgi:hypothetical protein
VFRTLGAGLAAGLVLVAAQVPANAADDPAPTRFSEFAITPTTVDVDHPKVTYTGRLVYTGADGLEQGLPDAPVCLRKDALCIGYTDTDADGRFTSSVTLGTFGESPTMVEGNAAAQYQGDQDHSYALATPGMYLYVHPVKTHLSIGFDRAPTVIGDKVNVIGVLERGTPVGGWTPAPGQTVTLFWRPNAAEPSVQIGQAVTAADGTYSIPATVLGGGYWNTRTPFGFMREPSSLGWGDGAYRDAWADTALLTAKYRTTITEFNASPEPVGKGATLTASGRVLRYKADGSTEPGTGSPMLQFSTDGAVWKNVSGVKPDAGGHFAIKTPAASDGYWRVDTSQKPGEAELPTTSGADYVDVRYRTAISGFNASPEPIAKGKRLTVAGTLKRDTTAWKAFSGQSVKVYFAAKGATSWTYEGTAKTSSTGHFSHTFTASKDGTWRATYAGSTTYVAVTGTGDYVDVR